MKIKERLLDFQAALVFFWGKNVFFEKESEIKYTGVGGHLFAIAAKKSCDFGYNGLMTGFAANKKLLEHYCDVFNAQHIGILHPFQFAVDEENARKIMEVYDYEWTNEQI